MPRFEIEQSHQLVIEQNKQRKVWATQPPEFLENYAREEFQELVEATWPQERDWDRWELASEIGDVEYLCVRLEQALPDGEQIPADIFFFRRLAWNMASYMGINVADAVHMKVIRNDLKYPVSITNSHEYDDGRDRSKKLWSLMGGDKAFYKWYAEVYGEV